MATRPSGKTLANPKPHPLSLETKRLAALPIPTQISGSLAKLPRGRSKLGGLGFRKSWAIRDIVADPDTMMLTYSSDGVVKGVFPLQNMSVAPYECGEKFAFSVTASDMAGNENTLILAAADEVDGQRGMNSLKKFPETEHIKAAHAARADYGIALKRWQDTVAENFSTSREGDDDQSEQASAILDSALRGAAHGKIGSGANVDMVTTQPKRQTKLSNAIASRVGAPPPPPPSRGNVGKAASQPQEEVTLDCIKTVTSEMVVVTEDVDIEAKMRLAESREAEKEKILEAERREEELEVKRREAIEAGQLKIKKKGLFKEKVNQVIMANRNKKETEDNLVGSIKQERVKMLFDQGENATGHAADIAATLAAKKKKNRDTKDSKKRAGSPTNPVPAVLAPEEPFKDKNHGGIHAKSSSTPPPPPQTEIPPPPPLPADWPQQQPQGVAPLPPPPPLLGQME